jgi:hypothetical protein
MNIVTRFDPPPIPLRQFDWKAYLPDLYDGAPDSGEWGNWVGRGATKEAAIADLLDQIADYIEERLAEENCYD